MSLTVQNKWRSHRPMFAHFLPRFPQMSGHNIRRVGKTMRRWSRWRRKTTTTKAQARTDLLLPFPLMGTLGAYSLLNQAVICQLLQGAGNSFTSRCKALHLLSNVLHFKHLLIVDLLSLPLFRQLPLVSVLPPTAAPLFCCQVLLLANRKYLICKLNYAQSPHHSGNNNVLIDRNKKPQDVFVSLMLC